MVRPHSHYGRRRISNHSPKCLPLSCHGYRNDFYVIPPENKVLDLLSVEESCLAWFGMAPDRWLLAGANEEERTLSIATSWDTVEYLASSSHGAPGFYFVQDYEPWFFSLDSNFLAAENTYRHGLRVVTIGKWLAGKIDREYGSVLGYTDFGVGPSYYSEKLGCCENSNPASEHAVCAIYQPEKGRRVAPLLVEAIRIALELDPSLTFYLYGSDDPVPISDHRVVSLGLISTDECRELYWRCKCGVSLSISNPSRIPFEMMACGLPVIDLYRENNLFDFRDGSLLLARSDAASLATAIVSLAADREKRDSLRRGGVLILLPSERLLWSPMALRAWSVLMWTRVVLMVPQSVRLILAHLLRHLTRLLLSSVALSKSRTARVPKRVRLLFGLTLAFALTLHLLNPLTMRV